jgi:histone deacetylase 11
MAYDRLIEMQRLSASDRILIIDVDAHHGNGNAYVFMENRNAVLLDMYNDDVYPKPEFTKNRVATLESLNRSPRPAGFHVFRDRPGR